MHAELGDEPPALDERRNDGGSHVGRNPSGPLGQVEAGRGVDVGDDQDVTAVAPSHRVLAVGAVGEPLRERGDRRRAAIHRSHVLAADRSRLAAGFATDLGVHRPVEIEVLAEQPGRGGLDLGCIGERPDGVAQLEEEGLPFLARAQGVFRAPTLRRILVQNREAIPVGRIGVHVEPAIE